MPPAGLSSPPPPPPVGMSQYPPLTFITSDASSSDYRPAVDATGTRVVFERTPFPDAGGTQPTILYIAAAIGTSSQTVAPFLTVPAILPAGFPLWQTRPDWSWAPNDQIAFSGATSLDGTITVHIVAATGIAPHGVANTGGRIYPIWANDGNSLVVYDNAPAALPAPPVSALISPLGTVIYPNLNGVDPNNVQVFGGLAAPRPGSGTPPQIAFAGQPALTSWATSTPSPTPTYNQDYNYVYVNSNNNGVFSSRPLEAGANIAIFDPAYQGRAPYWSPDGNYLVFESSRAGGYALFLVNVAAGGAPVQLTDPTYWAQHTKFLPGGTSIVFTALQQPSTTMKGPRGIATLDISTFLS